MTGGRLLSIPIFPLEDVVLFPDTHLPLHIFEPRYRSMVADAMAGDRVIGIQLLRPSGTGQDPAGRPAVYEVGCAGQIVEHEPLEDGRSNIVLRGRYRYRIVSEKAGRAYRVAEVEEWPVDPLPETRAGGAGRRELRRLLTRTVARLAMSVGREEASRLPTHLGDEGLVNEALTRLGLSAEDRYQLLTMERLEERYAWILDHVRELQARLDLLAPFRRKEADPRWN